MTDVFVIAEIPVLQTCLVSSNLGLGQEQLYLSLRLAHSCHQVEVAYTPCYQDHTCLVVCSNIVIVLDGNVFVMMDIAVLQTPGWLVEMSTHQFLPPFTKPSYWLGETGLRSLHKVADKVGQIWLVLFRFLIRFQYILTQQILARIWSHWSQMEQIWDFFRLDFSTFWQI